MKHFLGLLVALFCITAVAGIKVPIPNQYQTLNGKNTFNFGPDKEISHFNGDKAKLQFAECMDHQCFAVYKQGIAKVFTVSWCNNNLNYLAYRNANNSNLLCLANKKRILTANTCNPCSGLRTAFGSGRHFQGE